ncbi:mechanosensitive ion channel [Rhodobacteraceae bacterium M382]|nr:mechanosensitive ion channel [Rhodobacteraceae bacterium M382]
MSLMCVAVTAIMVFLMAPVANAQAVDTTQLQQTVDDLSSTLNQDQVNALSQFLTAMSQETSAVPVADGEQPTLIGALKTAAVNFVSYVKASFGILPSFIATLLAAFGGFIATMGIGGLSLFALKLAAAVAVGFGASMLASFVVSKLRRNLNVHDEIGDELGDQVRTLTLRFFMDGAGLIAFAIASLAVARLIFTMPNDATLAASMISLLLLTPLIARAIFRFLLAPHRPDLRTVTTDDWTAQFISRSFVGIAFVGGAAFFVNGQMMDASLEWKNGLRFYAGFAIHAWIIYVTWRARAGLTSILLGNDDNQTTGLARMAAWWPKVTMILVSLNWLTMQILIANDVRSITPVASVSGLVLVVAAPFLDTVLRGFVNHFVPKPDSTSQVAIEASQKIRFSYVRIGRVLLITSLVLMIGKLWGLGVGNLQEGSMGQKVALNGIEALLVVAVGYIIWEILNLWVNNRLAEETGGAEQTSEDAEAGGAGKSRLVSVLPLIHMAAQATIITITALLTISQFGIDIAPLLAGAGVLGLAIGFGAQTLVKDVVSGVFFLLDDAFRLGEFVDVGGTLGAIESISVRSLRLRDATGPVHIVPYGEIAKLTNHSRDYVIMKLKFTVPFDTDLEKVRKLFKKIGQELMADPAHAENMLAPFKSQGVADVNDVGIVLRGKFTAKPGTQFMMRKDIYNKVQKAFEENGIEFARKEVRVNMPEGHDQHPLTEEQKKTLSAAVAEAAEPADQGAGSAAPKDDR